MKLRTEIKPLSHQGVVAHDKPLMMIGSCFSDNIGERLRGDLFDVIINPWGTLYNPASIAAAVEKLCGDTIYTSADVVKDEESGRCYAMTHHSSFAAPTVAEALVLMNGSLTAAREALPMASTVVITLGTTRVFTLRSTGDVVANCHKLPAAQFDERHLSVDETASLLAAAIEKLRRVNPELAVIFTVSPIRHSGATLADNSLAKATLRVAVDRVVRMHPEGVYYFPAYEIMLDDLRDYRFYAADLKHPSPLAVDYIYELFMQSYMLPSTIEAAFRCRKLSARLAHRLSDESTPASQAFVESTRQLTESLQGRYPYLKIKI